MNKYKYVFLGVFISFILFLIVGILFSIINSNSIIHINKYDKFDDTYKLLSEDVDKIKNDDCRVSVNYMMNRIKENNIDHDVKLREYYQNYYKDNMSFMDFYNIVLTTCTIDDNDNSYIEAMKAMVYPEYIKNKYNRGYEYHIKDYLYNDKGIDSLGTYTTIISELETVKYLLEELS